jgi:hypothetical protein
MEGRAVNLDTGGNGSPCLGATDHDDTHVTLLLFRGRASGTGLVRTNDETTVAIPRLCRGARKIASLGTNCGRYARYCDVEVAALVVASEELVGAELAASTITVRILIET